MRKSYYCDKISQTLHFLPDKVKFCCSYVEGPGIDIGESTSNIEERILLKREEIENNLAKGVIPRECIGCKEIKENTEYKRRERNPILRFLKKLFEEKKTLLAKHIIVDHFKQCDCSCVYCSQKYLYPDVMQNYDLLPIIKHLYSKKMISKDSLKVEFQGGGIAVLNEFEDLLKEFSKNNCKNYEILTNNIKYIPFTDLAGSDSEIDVCISLDSGCRETYKQLKGVDAFDTVVENIKKLLENPNIHLSLKYIIVNGINDNKDELTKFIDVALSLNVPIIKLEIDFRDMLWNKDFTIPQHYPELFDYAESYCEGKGIIYSKLPFTYDFLGKGNTNT